MEQGQTHNELGDTIQITAQSRSRDYTVDYTLNLNELWGSGRVKQEYPNYRIEDRMIVRGNISVVCDATDDEISFYLQPVFVTDSMNEESASIETYKSGNLNNSLYNVYSGGNYDVIILANSDGIGSMNIPYLKINYYDENNENVSVWWSLAGNSESTSIDTIETDGNSIESQYVDFVSLVEKGQYEEALAYQNDNSLSFDYEQVHDYYYYAKAMSYYTDKEFRPVVEALKILKNDVNNGFLDTSDIISSIENELSQMNGLYELKNGNFSHYLMIKDGQVDYKAAPSTPTSSSYPWEIASVTLGNDVYYMICGGYYSGIDGCYYGIVDNGQYITLVKPSWQNDGTFAGNYAKISNTAP